MIQLVADPTIAEFLAEAQRRRKLSMRGMANFLQVSPTAYNRWLNGQARPDPEYCDRIARRLGVSYAEVMRLAGHPAPDAPASTDDPPWLTQLIAEMRELQITESEADVMGGLVQGFRALREERGQSSDRPQPGDPEAPPAP